MATTLEGRVYQRAAVLTAVAKAVSENFGGKRKDFMEPRDLRDAVKVLRAAVRAVPGAYAVIVGGLAVQELGYERYTKDVDAVVDSDHFTEVLARLREAGFELTPLRVLKHRETGVELDLLREGAQLKDARLPLPHPRELGPNLGTATLPGLLRLKLDAHRLQDQADVVALLKPRLNEIERLCQEIPVPLRKEFLELAVIARREAGI